MPLTPGQTTLGTIRDTCRQRTDNVNNPFFSDTELNGYISSAQKELIDLLVEKDEDYFFNTNTFQTDGVNQFFALPSDCYKVDGVDTSLTGQTSPNSWITVHRFQRGERNRYNYPLSPAVSTVGFAAFKYRLAGNQIWFSAVPQINQYIRLLYVPRPTELVNDSDVVDGVSGWEELIVLEVCIRMCAKEETDPSVFGAQKAAMLKRIEDAAANRDNAEPACVTDVYSDGAAGYPWGDPFAGGGVI